MTNAQKSVVVSIKKNDTNDRLIRYINFEHH